MTIAEKLSMGGMVALIGIAAVFLILAILILIITIFSKALGSTQKGASKKATAVQPVAVPAAPVANDNALTAVITAAIYAILSSECENSVVVPDFEIRKIKEIKR